jgi:hypothetical protein
MKRCCFSFWFFYASRTSIGVVLHMGAHEYVLFDSGVTLVLGIWIFSKTLIADTTSLKSSTSRPVSQWIFLYLSWAIVSLLWTPAPIWFAGGKLLKICFEIGILLCLTSDEDIEKVTSYSMLGFLYGAIFAVSLYGLYPVDADGRAGVDGGLDGFDIARMIALAGVIAFVQWTTKPNRWHALQALVLAGGTMILINKSCIAAYSMAVAPLALKSGLRTLTKTLIVLGLLAWLSFPLVAPYLVPYIETQGYLTLTGRLFIWADAIHYISAKPFIGSGYDSAKVLLSNLGEFSPGHAHNEWLQNWMCLGIIGVILLFAIFGSFTKIAWKYRGLPVGQTAIALVVFGLVRGVTDPSVDLSPPMGLMLLLTARMNSLPQHGPVKETGRCSPV